VRPNKDIDSKKLKKEYRDHHLQNRKMLLDRNQGIYAEDLLVQ
jgi:hypothetical protein